MSDTNEPSPRPWRVAESVCGWQNCIEDANGNDIGSCWYNRDRLRAEADAALIVVAVNERDELLREMNGVREAARKVVADWQTALDERDRLRDIVRRLSRHLANYITSESENDLLREARAAIGEDSP